MDRGRRLVKMSTMRMNKAKTMSGAKRDMVIKTAKLERKEGLVLQKLGLIKANKGVKMQYSYPYLMDDVISYGRTTKYGTLRRAKVKDPVSKAYRIIKKQTSGKGREYLKTISKADKDFVVGKIEKTGKRTGSTINTKKYIRGIVAGGERNATKIYREFMKKSHIIIDDPTGVKSMNKGKNLAKLAKAKFESSKRRIAASNREGITPARRTELVELAKIDKLYGDVYKKIGGKYVESGLKKKYGQFATRNQILKEAEQIIKIR